MMRRAAILTLWFTLAYGLALAVSYAVMARIVGAAFDPFGPGVDSIMLIYVLPPMAALAVFQLIFGVATRIGGSWRFWAVGLPLVYLGAGTGFWLYFLNGQPWQIAATAMVMITGGVGLWLALRRVRGAT